MTNRRSTLPLWTTMALLCSLVIVSCSNGIGDGKASDTDSVVAGGYVHKVRVQPSYREARSTTSLTICYTIATSASSIESNRDIMFDGLTSTEAFTVRLRDIALRMHNDVWLDLDNERYKCIGSLMPYDLGLAPTKTIYLTFDIPLEKVRSANEAIVTVKDRHFGGGLMSFLLDPSSLAKSIASTE